MRVRIFHTSDLSSALLGDGPGTGLREVFAYDEQDIDPTGDPYGVLDEVFRVFNVGDDPEFGPPDPRAVEYRHCGLRSVSVGDVVDLGESFYACARVGWRRLDSPPTLDEGGTGMPARPTA